MDRTVWSSHRRNHATSMVGGQPLQLDLEGSKRPLIFIASQVSKSKEQEKRWVTTHKEPHKAFSWKRVPAKWGDWLGQVSYSWKSCREETNGMDLLHDRRDRFLQTCLEIKELVSRAFCCTFCFLLLRGHCEGQASGGLAWGSGEESRETNKSDNRLFKAKWKKTLFNIQCIWQIFKNRWLHIEISA